MQQFVYSVLLITFLPVTFSLLLFHNFFSFRQHKLFPATRGFTFKHEKPRWCKGEAIHLLVAIETGMFQSRGTGSLWSYLNHCPLNGLQGYITLHLKAIA